MQTCSHLTGSAAQRSVAPAVLAGGVGQTSEALVVKEAGTVQFILRGCLELLAVNFPRAALATVAPVHAAQALQQERPQANSNVVEV